MVDLRQWYISVLPVSATNPGGLNRRGQAVDPVRQLFFMRNRPVPHL